MFVTLALGSIYMRSGTFFTFTPYRCVMYYNVDEGKSNIFIIRNKEQGNFLSCCGRDSFIKEGGYLCPYFIPLIQQKITIFDDASSTWSHIFSKNKHPTIIGDD